jgi:hypothetical protein
MPDWEKLAGERLAGLGLELEEENEVIAEVADHLAEVFDALCREGIAEEEATCRALAQVADWKALKRKIYVSRKTEDMMEPRVKQFWAPGVLGFAVFFAFSMIMESASFTWYVGGRLWLVASDPLILNLGRGTPILRFHLESLVLLIFVGAMAAGLSRWAGGTLRTSLLSCIFPAVPFAVVSLIAVPIGLIVAHPISYRTAGEAILYMVLGWVLAPAAALLVGGLIVQRFVSGGSAEGRVDTRLA